MGGGVAIRRLLKRLDFWIGLLSAIVFIIALVATAPGDSGTQGGTGPSAESTDYSTYHQGTRGLRAIYALMAARGTAVSRWRRPLSSLGPEIKRLVVWQPAPLSDEDWQGLDRWVRAGGTLVLSLPPEINVERILPAGQMASVSSNAVVRELLPAGVSPVLQGVRQLESREGWFWDAIPDRSGVTALVVNVAGRPVAAGWPLGSGHVYLVAEPSLLADSRLATADHLTLAVNLLDPGGRGRLAFDEYHHGAEVSEDWWQTLRPQLRWTMLQAVLAALLVMIWVGARFGAPVAVPEGISREAAEFAHGLGNLLRESRANRWVLDRLARSFRRDVARYLGAAPGAGAAELGRLWHLHTGEPPEPLAGLLDQTAATEPSDRTLLSTLARMAEYRRHMHAGPRADGSPR